MGFVRSPCGRAGVRARGQASSGEVLCSEHRDALDAALLAIIKIEQVHEMGKSLRHRRERKSNCTHAGHRKRRGEKKMPEGLEIGRSNREPAVLQVALNSAV